MAITFDDQVAAERLRQLEELGYTPDHDIDHGMAHLLAQLYQAIGDMEPVKAAALVLAAKDLARYLEMENQVLKEQLTYAVLHSREREVLIIHKQPVQHITEMFKLVYRKNDDIGFTQITVEEIPAEKQE